MLYTQSSFSDQQFLSNNWCFYSYRRALLPFSSTEFTISRFHKRLLKAFHSAANIQQVFCSRLMLLQNKIQSKVSSIRVFQKKKRKPTSNLALTARFLFIKVKCFICFVVCYLTLWQSRFVVTLCLFSNKTSADWVLISKITRKIPKFSLHQPTLVNLQ